MFTPETVDRLAESQSIDAAAKATHNAFDNTQADHTFGLVSLPEKFKLSDLERYLPTRRRLRGKMETSAMESFAAYVKEHKERGAAAFVDATAMSTVAVLNMGGPEAPGHADNTAVFKPAKTAAYKALLVATEHNRRLAQRAAAEFLEDQRDNITCFNADGTEILVTNAIAAVRQLTIEAMAKNTRTVADLSEEGSTFDRVAASSPNPIPARINFKCVPYLGFEPRVFTMRLGIYPDGNKDIQLALRVINAEQHAEELGQELMRMSQAALGAEVPVLVGSYAVA